MLDRDLSSEILELVNSDRAFTDVHIEQDAPVMLKTPAGWEACELFPALREDLEPMLGKIDPDWENTLLTRSINRPYTMSRWRLRVNAYLTQGGDKIALSIRKLPLNPITLDKTGLPASVRLMADMPRGLILVAGATGSGKSTTMASIVDAINATRNGHVITIEDPIEYVHARNKCIFSQREVGVDGLASYNQGLQDAMRQRPDVIMIGEIRDRDTAETAILAAESGHLVMASLHASTAVGAVQKLLSFFGGNEREAKASALAAALIGVISQTLLPTKDKSGFALASEMLFNHNQQFSKYVADPLQLQMAFDRGECKVSRKMGDSLYDLVANGVVSKADALRLAAYNRTELYDRLKPLA